MAPIGIEPQKLNELKALSPVRFMFALLGEYAMIALLLFAGSSSLAGLGLVMGGLAGPVVFDGLASARRLDIDAR